MPKLTDAQLAQIDWATLLVRLLDLREGLTHHYDRLAGSGKPADVDDVRAIGDVLDAINVIDGLVKAAREAKPDATTP